MFGCECFYWGRGISELDFESSESKPFSLPSSLPCWPQGQDFATGRINLKEIEVVKIEAGDSAVKYLQLANELFSQAELYHFCASILELVILVYKSRKAYGQLAKCHTLLTNIYESILDQESNPIPFIDATYYQVGFYGEKFGKLDRKEYVYREPRDVRLRDIFILDWSSTSFLILIGQ